MLWEVDIYPAPGQPDLLGRPISMAAAELGLAADLKVAAARSYLIQADWDRCQAERVALELLTDTVVETAIVAQVGDLDDQPEPVASDGAEWRKACSTTHPRASQARRHGPRGPKRDVGDRRFWTEGRGGSHAEKVLDRGPRPGPREHAGARVLANDAIEQVIVGPLGFRHLELGAPTAFA